MHRAGTSEEDYIDLGYIAATSAAFLASERSLRDCIRDAARAVKKLIEMGDWPSTGSMTYTNARVQQLVAQWAILYTAGADRRKELRQAEL